MKCPYCQNNMHEGIIHRDRYKLKWIPREKDKGVVFHPFVKGVDLPTNKNSLVIAFYCKIDDIFLIKNNRE